MSTVTVSQVPTTITHEKLLQFFGFCGSIRSINEVSKSDKTASYEITFESPKAVSTALLLNDAELEGVPIVVTELSNPPAYSGPSETVSDNKIQRDDATITGDDNYDDISQEEKPKSAIFAQLLAQGYNISDQLIAKSIKFDNEKGYSTKFKDFLTGLDTKYIHSQQPGSTANKNLNKVNDSWSSLTSSFQKSKYQQKLSHYFEKAQQSPYGVKIHEFYKTLAKDVTDVHNEAVRLNKLKKERSAEATPAPIATGAVQSEKA